MQELQILVADDDRPYCTLLKKTLTNSGHSVVICNSGEEVLDLFKRSSFDMLILDYKMEGISGIDVLRWMYEKKISTPVILITGHSSEELALDAWKWRAKDYFIKGKSDLSMLPELVQKVYKKSISDNKGK